MSSKHEEHPFKEWLSDNLRYLVLIVCIALGIVAIASGVRVYQSFHRQSAAKDEQSTDQTITIISQGESESGVTVSRQTVRKEPETEKETAATEKQTETETKKQTEKQTETETKKQTEKQTETETKKQTEKQAETETKKQTEKQTETQKQTEEIDTLKRYSSAATLYADEESNIRSGPGTGVDDGPTPDTVDQFKKDPLRLLVDGRDQSHEVLEALAHTMILQGESGTRGCVRSPRNGNQCTAIC